MVFHMSVVTVAILLATVIVIEAVILMIVKVLLVLYFLLVILLSHGVLKNNLSLLFQLVKLSTLHLVHVFVMQFGYDSC